MTTVRPLGTACAGAAVLAALLSGCASEEEKASDRDQLDQLADTVDVLAARLVPAAEHAAGAQVTSWQGSYRVCSDPTFTDVSYVVSTQLDGDGLPEARARRRLLAALDRTGWEASEDGDFSRTEDGVAVTARLVVGAYAIDLELQTECVEVANDVGKEYGDRGSRDFLTGR